MKPTVILILLALSISSYAQSFQKTDLGMKSVINAVEIEIQFYDPSMVRV